MSTIETIILALIQGLTEFLPISSSAHLILPSQLLGWSDQGLAFDVAVHVGTLLAVMIYFRQEVANMFVAWTDSIVHKNRSFDAKLAWWIIFATIPAGLFGLFGKDFIEQHLRSAAIIALTTIVFGLLLGLVDIKGKQNKNIEQLGFKGAMMVGLAQAVALIPGTSRSGITMTMGMMLGLTRDAAARFSFLLSIPAIAMAGTYLTVKLVFAAHAVDWSAIALGASVAFVSAYTCIHYFLILLDKVGMMPFVVYRLLLGAFLVWFII
ncbi:undecaprenyl-diphosphate phosphatase [Thalassotalea ponticola]|uniref:undecaprenyl-diphosphate phosphatase n=1 Tax=Thalassotalea ponticola TaxID=1523392 RepID=UPI0025B31871|nr:undecaprenyl-diphosphate phosphatase [Thalassotalea ponticola]MDN3651965.1 undecaprenyl-diphosphate phosphatase [Thalassotalea ponticola]